MNEFIKLPSTYMCLMFRHNDFFLLRFISSSIGSIFEFTLTSIMLLNYVAICISHVIDYRVDFSILEKNVNHNSEILIQASQNSSFICGVYLLYLPYFLYEELALIFSDSWIQMLVLYQS